MSPRAQPQGTADRHISQPDSLHGSKGSAAMTTINRNGLKGLLEKRAGGAAVEDVQLACDEAGLI